MEHHEDFLDEQESSSDSSLSLHTISDDEEFLAFEYLDSMSKFKQGCLQNNVEIVEEAIKAGKELNLGDNRGNTALHYACNSVHVLRLLLKQPTIRVNVQNHEYNTPLHYTLHHTNPNLEAVQMLLEAGSDVTLKNNFNISPIYQVCLFEEKELQTRLLVLFLEKAAGVDIDTIAYVMTHTINLANEKIINHNHLLTLFEYYGADITCQYKGDDSLFMYAVSEGLHDIVNLWFDYEYDFNRVMEDGHTTFMKAIKWCSPRVFDMIHNGADINACSDKGSCLYLSMLYTDPALFYYIWENCDTNYLLINTSVIQNFELSFDGILSSFLREARVPCDDIIQILYTVLDFNIGGELLHNAVGPGFYNHLIKMFHQFSVPKSTRVCVLYACLIHCNRIMMRDLCHIVSKYGFNEELEAFLVVNVDIVRYDLVKSDFFRALCYPQYSLRSHTTQLISLVELSRDEVRRNLQPRHKIGTNHIFFQYYNSVQQLNVPQVIKDIICLKRNVDSTLRVDFEPNVWISSC